uniref:Integrase core domain containing protein n=1 Tax=Solanum tuberosum TaxID=4113 RepID=M1DA63_SOLTU
MSQLDLLSKHVMGGGLKSVNAVRTTDSAQRMPSLRINTIRKYNTWETKWWVLTQTTNDKVRTKLTQYEASIDSHGVTLDNLTSRLEAKEKGEAHLLDAPESVPTAMPSSELPQSMVAQPSVNDVIVHDGAEREEDRANDDLAEETDEEKLRREEVE